MKRSVSLLGRGLFAATLLLAATATAQADKVPSRPQYKIENNELKVPGQVVFQTASDKLSPESDAVLEFVRGYLADKSYITLRVEGHSDSDGNASANQTLTEKRALSVARWLVAHGIDCKRVIPVGFGGTKPIAANDSPTNKALNRRVAFVNAALRGIAIGGMSPDGGGKLAGDPCAK